MRILNFLAAVALGLFLFNGPVASQGAYPDKPIRIIMPFPPGAAADVDLRYISTKLGEALGQPIVVDPRSGASGVIGVQAALAAPHDGYTLLYISNPFFLHPLIIPNLRFDLLRDFTPLAVTVVNEQILVVKSDSPFNSAAELAAFGKAHPGKLTYGSAGIGSLAHLAAASFAQLGNFEAIHSPMRGQPDATRALLAGETDFSVLSMILARPQIAGKRIKPLATTGGSRSAVYPNVPTLLEAMPPGFVYEGWAGLMAPADVPAPIVERLRRELASIVRKPETAEFYRRIDAHPLEVAPSALVEFYKAEEAKMMRFGKAAGIKSE